MLNSFVMTPPSPLTSLQSENRSPAFWERIVNDESLTNCNNLEKLIAGCEIIVALDDLDLLAA